MSSIVAIPQQGAAVTVGHLRVARRPEGVFVSRDKDGASVSYKSFLPKIPLSVLACIVSILQRDNGYGTALNVLWSAERKRYYLRADGAKDNASDFSVLRVASAGALPAVYIADGPFNGSVTGLYLKVGRLYRPAPEFVLQACLEGKHTDVPVFGLFEPLPPKDVA